MKIHLFAQHYVLLLSTTKCANYSEKLDYFSMLNSRMKFGPARISDGILDRAQSAARKIVGPKFWRTVKKRCYKILYRLLPLPLQTVDP
jgi:hypothetical protein